MRRRRPHHPGRGPTRPLSHPTTLRSTFEKIHHAVWQTLVSSSGRARRRKFALADAQKNKINQTACKSTAKIRSWSTWCDSTFDCKCRCTKSECPKRVPKITTHWSIVGKTSSPLQTPVQVNDKNILMEELNVRRLTPPRFQTCVLPWRKSSLPTWLDCQGRWMHLPMLPGFISPIATNICARSALRSTESSCVRPASDTGVPMMWCCASSDPARWNTVREPPLVVVRRQNLESFRMDGSLRKILGGPGLRASPKLTPRNPYLDDPHWNVLLFDGGRFSRTNVAIPPPPVTSTICVALSANFVLTPHDVDRTLERHLKILHQIVQFRGNQNWHWRNDPLTRDGTCPGLKLPYVPSNPELSAPFPTFESVLWP